MAPPDLLPILPGLPGALCSSGALQSVLWGVKCPSNFGRDGGIQINLGYECNGQIRTLLWEGSYLVTALCTLVGRRRSLGAGDYGRQSGPAGKRCQVLHPVLPAWTVRLAESAPGFQSWGGREAWPTPGLRLQPPELRLGQVPLLCL